MAAFDLTDYSTFFRVDGSAGLDLSFTPISRVRSRAEMIVRRWIATPGEMDDLDFGAGLLNYLNANLTPVQRNGLKARLRYQALQVEQVAEIQLELYVFADGSVKIPARFTMDDGAQVDMVFSLSPDKLPRITLLGGV